MCAPEFILSFIFDSVSAHTMHYQLFSVSGLGTVIFGVNLVPNLDLHLYIGAIDGAVIDLSLLRERLFISESAVCVDIYNKGI